MNIQPEWESIAVGVVFIFLGLSFAYKCYLAAFRGRLYYWEGFMPITLVSPLFIHGPIGKRSLIKTTERWWVHVVFGPIFFFLALGFLASGADRLNLPGTETVNSALTLGNQPNIPPSVVYHKDRGYTFPVLGRMSDAIFKIMSKPFMRGWD